MSKKVQEKLASPKKGDLVVHAKRAEPGLLIKKTSHCDYYRVIADGKITEWHISNIYLISDKLGD